MIRRNIQKRVGTIAPFLTLDRDPYLVVSEGRMFWMQDAYTTSEYFPYAQPAPGHNLNYIRNSVKVVIDAYNGTVDFYLMDPADPIAATYQRIFPALFKPLAVMPPDLQKHIRYPEDLFLMQARLFQTYHMEATDVFYNREDLWQFPRQPAGDGVSSMDGITTMMPYYIIMRLPGEAQAEFFIMIPMVPSRRDNMIAWLAARCDEPGYGKLIVYEFPKEKLVYGPFQIEARIHQNTEIAQQISLWNQMGSRVIRGNLLVIPIENSILYVSPLYLRAEQGHLPELKRVIAAYGEHVVMAFSSFQVGCDVFGVLLMALEDFQPGLQQALQLGIAGRRNQLRLQRSVDGLVVGDFVVGIGLVKRLAVQLCQLRALVGLRLGDRLAGVVVLRRHLELLHQSERLLIDRFVIAQHARPARQIK